MKYTSMIIFPHTPDLKLFLFVLQPSIEEVLLTELQISSQESCLKSETQALIQPNPSTCGFSSPLSQPTDRLETSVANLKHSLSRESLGSLRRASSLHDIDGMRDQWSGKNKTMGIQPVETNSIYAFMHGSLFELV